MMTYLGLGFLYVLLACIFSKGTRRDVLYLGESEPLLTIFALVFAMVFWPVAVLFDVVANIER